MERGGIWVWTEHHEGAERPVVHELLSRARQLADRFGKELVALIAGNNAEKASARIKGHPDTILLLEGDPSWAPESSHYLAALEGLCRRLEPSLILAPNTVRTMDWMPALAARLQRGMVSEVTALELTEDARARVTRPIHGGRFLVELEAEGPPPHLVAVRPRAFARVPGEREGRLEKLPVEAAEGTRAPEPLERSAQAAEGPDLAEASIVVAGGRGMGGPDGFSMLEELARLLGGAVGASRSVVDSGWRPASEQVGKSGKTVSADLYMAFGISGAVHHVMGMDTSRTVVAVNRDPNALIFQHSDYGVVDDIQEFLPMLIRQLKAEG